MKRIVNKYHQSAKGKRQGKVDGDSSEKNFRISKAERYKNHCCSKNYVRKKVQSEGHCRQQGCKAEKTARNTGNDHS